ncbi:Glutaredoxin arsenate reductase [bioreactor metagenome]|uniref:Glutaredoxin arsenate reductase n=1 Tax=bioreactor metagenome TaxID=1076179 RepID=A0A644VDG6_9ZZZZ|nr:arsenate reductase ArsC [Methanocorpusculum sp.]
MKRIAFLCIKNSCRSQIAEALCRHLGGERYICYSAGSDPGDTVDPTAVHLMQEIYGIDLSTHRPKKISDLPKIDIIVTMGCGIACPVVPGTQRIEWHIDDPVGKDDDAYFQAIAEIEANVKSLIE